MAWIGGSRSGIIGNAAAIGAGLDPVGAGSGDGWSRVALAGGAAGARRGATSGVFVAQRIVVPLVPTGTSRGSTGAGDDTGGPGTGGTFRTLVWMVTRRAPLQRWPVMGPSGGASGSGGLTSTDATRRDASIA